MALLQKTENLPPQLSGEFVRAIFEGKKYPRYALNQALERNRAEIQEGIYPYRVGLIKAILIRTYEVKELTVSLNVEVADIGYRLGRLFCVLERTQEDAHERQLNRTIRENYYGSASTLPGTVFQRLMTLNMHHLKKLRSQGGLGIWKAKKYQEDISNIMDGIDVTDEKGAYPIRLNLKQQGLFAVGYYHQRHLGYPKKQTSDTETEQGE